MEVAAKSVTGYDDSALLYSISELKRVSDDMVIRWRNAVSQDTVDKLGYKLNDMAMEIDTLKDRVRAVEFKLTYYR